MEEWRDAVGFEGLYEVSNFGRVRRADTKTELKGNLNSYGYRVFSLFKESKRYTAKAHRLVAEAFIPNPDHKRNVNHKDGDRDNNFVENLEWASHGENERHARQQLSIDYAAKPVVQLSLQGDVIAVWANARLPAQVYGVSAQLISACCKGTAKTAGDFQWKYAEFSFERGIKEIQIGILREKLSTITKELSTLERDLG